MSPRGLCCAFFLLLIVQTLDGRTLFGSDQAPKPMLNPGAPDSGTAPDPLRVLTEAMDAARSEKDESERVQAVLAVAPVMDAVDPNLAAEQESGPTRQVHSNPRPSSRSVASCGIDW